MNVLVTNFNGSGEDVMVFTQMAGANVLEQALNAKGQQFDEIYEVSDEQLPYYIYDPCWLSAEEEQNAFNLSN